MVKNFYADMGFTKIYDKNENTEWILDLTNYINKKPAPAPTGTGQISEEMLISQKYCIIFGAALQAKHSFAGCYFCTHFYIF